MHDLTGILKVVNRQTFDLAPRILFKFGFCAVNKTIFISIVCFFLSSCSFYSSDIRLRDAVQIAQSAAFESSEIPTRFFTLYGFLKATTVGGPMVVYVEGDGFSWVNKYTVSGNPTPRNPLALKLAVRDSSQNVVYLGRPCQYVETADQPLCASSQTWTKAQFSMKIIDGYDQALDSLKKKYQVEGFHLVGFSGGGAVVTLLASSRDDIKSIRTVAGNLDHVTLNRYRNVSPLVASYNPIDVVGDIRHVPQTHYSGSLDEVIPSWVAQRFVRKLNNPKCGRAQTISGASHVEGWVEIWSQLHKKLPECISAKK